MGDWEQILRDLSENDFRHGGFFKEALAEIALLRVKVESLQTYVSDALTVETLKATIAQQAERIRQLENAVAFNDKTSQHYLNDRTEARQQVQKQAETIQRQAAVIKKCEAALTQVQDLISESNGVYGLHFNGDNSPWDEIEQGGRFERLCNLPEALAAIKECENALPSN